jgi:hypothetical protein
VKVFAILFNMAGGEGKRGKEDSSSNHCRYYGKNASKEPHLSDLELGTVNEVLYSAEVRKISVVEGRSK